MNYYYICKIKQKLQSKKVLYCKTQNELKEAPYSTDFIIIELEDIEAPKMLETNVTWVRIKDKDSAIL